MSITKSAQAEEKPVTVMAKGFDNEPAQVMALAVDLQGSTVEIARRDPSKRIGLPRDCVFDFDEALFAQIRIAYESGNRQRLVGLWQKARPFSAQNLPARA